MPRNSSGTYTLPAGNPVAPNTIIETAWANPTMSDLGSALTDSLDRFGRGSMLAPIKEIDGVFNAPAYTFASESTLGIYRPSSGVLGVAVAGLTALSLSATAATFDPLVHPVWAADPVSGNDLVRKSYLASQVGLYLPLTGGALAGPGNLTIAGTLGVTGLLSGVNATLSGTLGVTGVTTHTGAVNGGNSSWSGTLGVTGNSTLTSVALSGLISATAAEALRINNSGGFISGYSTGGATRTGYLQFNAAASVILAAENSAALNLSVGGTSRLYIDTTNGSVNINRSSASFSSTKLWVNQAVNKNLAFYYSGSGNPTIAAFDDAGAFITMRVAGSGVNISGDGGATSTLQITSGNVIQDSAGLELGYRAIPRIDQSGGSAANTIRGKMQGLTSTSTYTVPASIFTSGDAFSICNFNAGAVTIAQGAGLTMHFLGATGNRSLAGFGIATVWFANAGECWISGLGVT